MRHTVLWTPETEQELTEIWLQSNDRNRVTAAANEIDNLLQYEPESVGESRSEKRRILFSPSLGVLFVVHEEDRTVYVINIWKFQDRSSSK